MVRFCWGPIAEVLEKNPDANGACVVRWPDDEEDPSLAWQRESMAAFLGKRKRAAVERHKVCGECFLVRALKNIPKYYSPEKKTVYWTPRSHLTDACPPFLPVSFALQGKEISSFPPPWGPGS